MKKLNYIIILLLAAGIGFFVFNSKKDAPDLRYQEPQTSFFNKSDVPLGAIVVDIKEDEFTPNILTIKKGETVTWVNSTKGYTWPASDPHPTHTNYSSTEPFFDPELPMKSGEAWSFTFQKAGSWKYHDHLDPTKRGVIQVSE